MALKSKGIYVEIGADTDPLKSDLNKAENELRQFQAQVNGMSANKIGKEMSTLQGDISRINQEIAGTNRELAEAQAIYNKTPTYDKTFLGIPEMEQKLQSLQVEADITNQKLNKINDISLKEVDNSIKQVSKTVEENGNKTAKAFSKGLWSVKRFALSLFGIEAIWALISRASQSYLETDDQLRASTELTTNVFGQLLAPAIRVVTELLQYAAIGFALLIKMFTGFDALAKVTTKNITKAGKATKELNNELTAMDEITNVNGKQSGAGGLDLTADFAALDEFNEKIKTVEKLFDDIDMKGIVDKLKEFGGWVVQNKDWLIDLGIQLGIIFGVAKISSWIINIGKLIGIGGTGAAAGTGMAGMAGLLKFMGTIGIISIGVSLLYKGMTGRDLWSDLKDINDEVQKQGGWLKLAGDWWSNFFNKLFKPLNDWRDKLSEIGRIAKSIPSSATGQGGGFSGGSSFGGGGGFGGSGSAFATGGVVTGPTRAIVGEYNGAINDPEIISPQSMMKETMMEALNQIMPKMQNNRGGGDVILQVNGKEFARATYDDFQSEGQRNGKSTTIRRVG